MYDPCGLGVYNTRQTARAQTRPVQNQTRARGKRLTRLLHHHHARSTVPVLFLQISMIQTPQRNSSSQVASAYACLRSACHQWRTLFGRSGQLNNSEPMRRALGSSLPQRVDDMTQGVLAHLESVQYQPSFRLLERRLFQRPNGFLAWTES